jgi:type I restriction enzyme S subunit
MNSWRDTTMGELLKVEHGFAFKGEHFSDAGDLIVLTPGNFHEGGGFRARPDKDRFYQGRFPDRYLLNKNDLIVAMTEQGEGLLGSSALIPESGRFLHNQRLGLVRPVKDAADKTFLYYLFRADYVRQQIRNSSAGAKIRHTSPERIYRTKVRVPDKPCQAKIGAILLAYDALIENNHLRLSLLEKMAEEIYREWFVRLRFPCHEKVKKVKGVPETWDNTRFGKFCMLKRGYDLPDKSVEPGEYPVIASTSITTYHNEFKVNPPVITTGRSGSLGTVLMVHSKAWPLNTALYVKDFFGNSPYLVFYTLKNMGLETFNSGAGVPTLNRNHINGIKIAVPDKELQRRFDTTVSPIHRQTEQIKNANAILTNVRDLLLPRLISGKLSVENLEIQFPPGWLRN